MEAMSAMGVAFLIMFCVCASVLASVGVVFLIERSKKNGFKKVEEGESGENGNIIELEKIAHSYVERERKLNGTTL